MPCWKLKIASTQNLFNTSGPTLITQFVLNKILIEPLRYYIPWFMKFFSLIFRNIHDYKIIVSHNINWSLILIGCFWLTSIVTHEIELGKHVFRGSWCKLYGNVTYKRAKSGFCWFLIYMLKVQGWIFKKRKMMDGCMIMFECHA